MIAGHYFDQGTSYILLYSQHPDVCVDFPPKLREEALHVAQASYAISGRKGISVYSFPSSKVSELEKITFTREVYLDKTPKTNPTELANILQTYGIQTEVLCDGWETILDIIARDVKVHAGRKRPKQEHANDKHNATPHWPATVARRAGHRGRWSGLSSGLWRFSGGLPSGLHMVLNSCLGVPTDVAHASLPGGSPEWPA